MEIFVAVIIGGAIYLLWKKNSKETKKVEYRKIVNFSKR